MENLHKIDAFAAVFNRTLFLLHISHIDATTLIIITTGSIMVLLLSASLFPLLPRPPRLFVFLSACCVLRVLLVATVFLSGFFFEGYTAHCLAAAPRLSLSTVDLAARTEKRN